ncbi:bifunctional ADP-dependent NAD(P)H-hydrate dehydratase/NAD(P)H-hydrate epimerase [Saccharicrinis fermentans]|uniref:Bifunctional NAD(P)H-hydrate repair enzyme n=1 Tax=Saccharicrinis fermentans DSM 9555 = JCM 21142 TaxID=869213 RepID=W7YAX3_9BACT|nr:bifunctional ADP-dependent NAD(P)H-hydrate dehydratase/NAD(P)H-hydrate epimerase [Saccharicrinis fermentans]GAF01516.1 nicotinamide nucleotide repair protein [Saccharicrinis fermentans DSM 9555 = JCM 21142]
MKILTPKQTRELDQFTIDHEPIASIDLMERAAQKCMDWIISNIDASSYYIFCGTGNNGGDGLAITRMLDPFPYNKKAFLIHFSDKLSKDAKLNYKHLKKTDAACLSQIDFLEDIDFNQIEPDAIIIDAIFGSGLNRPVEGLAKLVIEKINELPNKVISIDIPSGLMAEYDESYAGSPAIIKADITLTFQTPKLSFLLPENSQFVGHWHVLDIGLLAEYIEEQKETHVLVEKDYITSIYKHRLQHSHKGNYGHALLIAGCYGKMGAAILASKGCLKAGVGLLTVHVPHWGYNIIQSSVPEAMASIDRSEMIFTEFPELNGFNAIAIGPGLNKKKNSVVAFENMLSKIEHHSLVVDADGLNILSENKHLLNKLPQQTILTPHPKEFERLAGSWKNDMHRLKILKDFCQQYQVITVLKGAYTVTCMPDGRCYFNTTGNPGMATAGSGDVLTGIILALLAQNYPPDKAATLAVYLHGKAGDKALLQESKESLIASDIIRNLGNAFKSLN